MAETITFTLDKRELNRLQRVLEDKASDALMALAEEVVTIAKLSMENSPAAGATYTRGSVSHTASLPGEPPRIDIGTLHASIRAYSEAPLKKIVSDGVEYGVYLEFGTEGRMKARPWLTPAVMEAKTKVKDIFDGFLDD